MGADLILNYCSHPSNLGLTTEEGKELLRKFAFSATPELLDAFFDHASGTTLEQEYAEEVGDGDLEHLSRAQDTDGSAEPLFDWGRARLWKNLEDAYDSVFGYQGRRDLGLYKFGGLYFALSGGMSWGDEPTFSGPKLSLLDWTGVFDPCGDNGELRKGVLDLSTSHVPRHIVEGSSADLEVYWRCQDHEYGWIVFLGDKRDDENSPDWFKPVLKLARALNCDLINFETNGVTTQLLPLYE